VQPKACRFHSETKRSQQFVLASNILRQNAEKGHVRIHRNRAFAAFSVLLGSRGTRYIGFVAAFGRPIHFGLGVPLTDSEKAEFESFVLACQNEDGQKSFFSAFSALPVVGGFGGSPGHDSHLLYTLSAVQVTEVRVRVGAASLAAALLTPSFILCWDAGARDHWVHQQAGRGTRGQMSVSSRHALSLRTSSLSPWGLGEAAGERGGGKEAIPAST